MSIGSLKVKIFDASGTQLVAVPKSTFTVGSANHCDIVLQHASVQSEHVRGWLEGGRIWVQDLGAAGGTFLNGIRLPSLKPMLVRDLDILKIGDCPSTLGLEANLVRAPIVKPRPAVEEHTMNDVRPLVAKEPEVEKRREEVQRLSRELAEVKLQLQMGRLDKNAEDDLHRQGSKLRDDLRKLSQEKDMVADAIQKLEQDRERKRSALEDEIAALRSKAEQELNALREAAQKEVADMRGAAQREILNQRQSSEKELARMRETAARELEEAKDEKTARISNDDSWRQSAVLSLNESVKQLSSKKAKAWVTRPLSKDMMFELEGDLNVLFRRIILNEDVPDLPELPEAARAATSTSAASKEVTGPGVSGITYLTKSPSRTGLNAVNEITRSVVRSRTDNIPLMRAASSFFPRAAFGVLAGCLLGFAIFYGQDHISKFRSVGFSEVVASIPAANQIQRQPTSTPVKMKFEPKQTRGFKKSYTDNALYTSLYIEAELNSEFRGLWLAEVDKAARLEWKLDPRAMASVNEKEFGLIQDLRRLRESIQPQTEAEGIQRMREREAIFMSEIEALLQQRSNLEKYLKLKRAFFNRNQAYLVRK